MPDSIFHSGFQPCLELEHYLFVLFPTDPDYSAPDYEAVMASKEELRIWSASDWPEDDFTLEANRNDLGGHVEDNRNHSAYGYMIFSPDREICYGSVYLNPIKDWRDRFACLDGNTDELDALDARVDHWIRSDHAELEIPILDALSAWLFEKWKIRAGFVVRPGLSQRAEAMEILGAHQVARLRYKDGTGELSLFSL